MSISSKDLDHVLNLAHIEIPEEEKSEYLPQLTKVIDNMAVLDKANLSDLPPTSHPLTQETLTREDSVKNLKANLSKNAPEWENQCYRVPKMGVE